MTLNCAICLSEVSRGTGHRPGDGKIIKATTNTDNAICHLFHSRCLKKWVKISNDCPICRMKFIPKPTIKQKISNYFATFTSPEYEEQRAFVFTEFQKSGFRSIL